MRMRRSDIEKDEPLVGCRETFRPAISVAAPKELREVLKADWTIGGQDCHKLAEETVKLQLESAIKLKGKQAEDAKDETVFDENLPGNELLTSIWKNEMTSFVTLCAAITKAEESEPEKKKRRAGSDAPFPDIDEWILRNEKWMRARAFCNPADWKEGLVALSKDAGTVFRDSKLSDTSRKIIRSTFVPGFSILDGKQTPAIFIQPNLILFQKAFDEMSDNLLRGLDWSNVFVAGGIVLGMLTCIKSAQAITKPDDWISSDIDIYIYGLGPVEANAKLQHVFDTFKSNLPAGAPVLAVRNSKTITFYSNYPLKRIQIVLKLVKSPKEVLLNFDLDVCAIGWDGTELWMLPRAVRALETGYTVFTMNLINGHYLGDRRATQEPRVFKYAHRGYGIRFLPSYIAKLDAYRGKVKDIARGEHFLWPTSLQLDMEKTATESRKWFNQKLDKLREWQSLPIHMSHADMEWRQQRTSEPQRRSCLHNFRLLMRHVALFEAELEGKVVLSNDEFASTNYDETVPLTAYDDCPRYQWDKTFDHTKFKQELDRWNDREREPFANVEPELSKSFTPRRVAYNEDLTVLLSKACDIIIPIWIPRETTKYLDNLMIAALREAKLPTPQSGSFFSTEPKIEKYCNQVQWGRDVRIGLKVFLWRMSNITMWQLIDRRIDESHETLWAFHRANERDMHTVRERVGKLRTQLAVRAIRSTLEDEHESFARWVSAEPALRDEDAAFGTIFVGSDDEC